MPHTVTYIIKAKGFDYSDEQADSYPGCDTPKERAEFDVEQLQNGECTLDELFMGNDLEVTVMSVVEEGE